jgi:transposase
MLRMLDVRELIRRLRAGDTDRTVARELGVARKTVARYREVAQRKGLLDGTLLPLDELERCLRDIVPVHRPPRQPFRAAKHRERIEALRRDGVEVRAIYQRLQTECQYGGSYAGLHRYVRFLEGVKPEGFIRIEVKPGDEAQVDFGYAGRIVDPATGKRRKAWAFIMTLSWSRHQYAVLVFDQKIDTWLRCHREAFDWFGGVPRKIVIDNLKAGITKAVFYDPVPQRNYRDFAEHYGFLIAPCRPRAAWHKGKVESGVHYVKRNFLAGRAFADVHAANVALRHWVLEEAGLRTHGTTKERPLERFREVEQAALLPLPVDPYDMGLWKQATLHPDCHVIVDGAYYSAPHRLIGEHLWVRTNGREVHIFHDWERIASHAWGPPGTRRTIDAHYPPAKQAWLQATPAACRERARAIGPATTELVERLFNDRPLDRTRTVHAILRLASKYGNPRLEAAARRALHFNDLAHRTVKNILEQGLDQQPLPALAPVRPLPTYRFARPGSDYFPKGPDHGAQHPVDPETEGAPLVGHSGDARHA